MIKCNHWEHVVENEIWTRVDFYNDGCVGILVAAELGDVAGPFEKRPAGKGSGAVC